MSEAGGGKLLLTIGEIVDKKIRNLSQVFDRFVDKYLIMPNHIHLLVLLQGKGVANTLSDMLCALKSRTTKLTNEMDGQAGRRIWQRSFHDHIIQDEKDYLKIWQYIDENPVRWEQDCFYHHGEQSELWKETE